MNNETPDSKPDQSEQHNEGAQVLGDVTTDGGDFIGRDQTNIDSANYSPTIKNQHLSGSGNVQAQGIGDNANIVTTIHESPQRSGCYVEIRSWIKISLVFVLSFIIGGIGIQVSLRPMSYCPTCDTTWEDLKAVLSIIFIIIAAIIFLIGIFLILRKLFFFIKNTLFPYLNQWYHKL